MNQPDVAVEVMRAAGLSDHEIAGLAMVKRRVDAGLCNDLTLEYKRLMFFRLLCETGRLHG
jgi:hypothetical protein